MYYVDDNNDGAPMTIEKIPVLILQLGLLQVYTFQTNEEILNNDKPKDYFWKQEQAAFGSGHGPFATIADACKSYEYLMAQFNRIEAHKDSRAGQDTTGKVIYVDFVKKCRVK